MEDESNKRIKKYADYAKEMKDKFTDYESQSEKYYSEMLEKFKTQARSVVQKKQKELDELKEIKKDHEARILRLKERTTEKKIKNFWSDESEESEDEPAEIVREVSMEDYEYVKAQRTAARIAIVKFVKKFKEDNNRFPTDSDTGPIAMELADYNHINQKYLDVKI